MGVKGRSLEGRMLKVGEEQGQQGQTFETDSGATGRL